MTEKIELIKYRDSGMATYTYFWVNSNRHTISPFFDNEQDAKEWLKNYGKQPNI